jgi:hypothetical protein
MSPVSPVQLHRRLAATLVVAIAALQLLLGCAEAPRRRATSPIEAQAAPDGVLLQQDGAPILFYRSQPEPGRESWRVHYLHPVHTLAGDILTEDAPVDHLHQRGIFWAWRRVLVDGVPVADGWVGRQFELQAGEPRVTRHADGSVEIHARVRWIVPTDGKASAIIEESSTIRAFPLVGAARRIDLDTRLIALRPGVALAGTDDEKGYGGPSFRLRDASALILRSDGRELRATVARMVTGPTVDFAWRDGSRLHGASISIACRVDDQPWTEWVLRQEPSMQNCAFPGRTPVAVPTDRALHLSSTLTLR